MNQADPPKKRTRAEQLYALCLRLYPRAHRRAYGPLMLQTFRDSYRDALATHGKGGMRFWLGVASDEAKSLLREHGSALGERAQYVSHVGHISHIQQWRFEIASAVIVLGSMAFYVAHCLI